MCRCFMGMSEKRLLECGDSYPLWTVDSLWQGTVPKPRNKNPLNIHACKGDDLSDSSAIEELNKVKTCNNVCPV